VSALLEARGLTKTFGDMIAVDRVMHGANSFGHG
jgi:hypothetical protein